MISLLNLDLKIISKAFASTQKTELPSIISSEQTSYIEKRFIVEGRRFISDVLSVTNNLKMKSYPLTIDIKKAFNSLDHSFLIWIWVKFQ